MSNLDEDSVDEILYLARANEATELDQFLSTLSTQISKPKDQLLAEAVDSYSQNTALHYAAANGHIGTSYPMRSQQRPGLTRLRYRKTSVGDKLHKTGIFHQSHECFWKHSPPLGKPQRASGSGQASDRSWW